MEQPGQLGLDKKNTMIAISPIAQALRRQCPRANILTSDQKRSHDREAAVEQRLQELSKPNFRPPRMEGAFARTGRREGCRSHGEQKGGKNETQIKAIRFNPTLQKTVAPIHSQGPARWLGVSKSPANLIRRTTGWQRTVAIGIDRDVFPEGFAGRSTRTPDALRAATAR